MIDKKLASQNYLDNTRKITNAIVLLSQVTYSGVEINHAIANLNLAQAEINSTYEKILKSDGDNDEK